jgi:hypothetical protein
MGYGAARLTATVACLLALAAPATAHHSHANYAQKEWVELEGTVTNVHWLNPHVWIFLEVASETGDPVVWAMEGGSIRTLTQGGWQRDSVHPGESISARCMPLKDRSAGCLLGFISTAEFDNKEFD